MQPKLARLLSIIAFAIFFFKSPFLYLSVVRVLKRKKSHRFDQVQVFVMPLYRAAKHAHRPNIQTPYISCKIDGRDVSGQSLMNVCGHTLYTLKTVVKQNADDWEVCSGAPLAPSGFETPRPHSGERLGNYLVIDPSNFRAVRGDFFPFSKAVVID